MTSQIHSYYETSSRETYISTRPRSADDTEIDLVPTYEQWSYLQDENSELEDKIGSLQDDIDDLECQIGNDQSEDLEFFLKDLAAQVNTYGHDPISIINDALKKYGIYLEQRKVA